jgi:hypothetical protein
MTIRVDFTCKTHVSLGWGAATVSKAAQPVRNLHTNMRFISLPSTKYLLLLALLVGLCMAISGCGPSITVNLVDPLENPLETQSMQLSNCDCDTLLVSGVDIEAEFKIDDYATTGSQNKRILIPPETKAELEAQLEMVYAPVYENAKASAGQIELTVPADMYRSFKIEWTQQVYNSTISFRKGLKTYTTTYTYVLKIPKEAGFVEIPCSP